MPKLISVLDVETKRVIASIVLNGVFCGTALNSLKINFGDSLLVAPLKIKVVSIAHK